MTKKKIGKKQQVIEFKDIMLEPIDAILYPVEDVELDKDIHFSIGIPIEMMFDEFTDDMLRNMKHLKKRICHY